MKPNRNRQEWENELKERQKNIQWHDTFRNGQLLDEFFFLDLTPVTLFQRIVAVLIALLFLCVPGYVALNLFWAAKAGPIDFRITFFMICLGMLFTAFGAKVLKSAFRRSKSNTQDRNCRL